MRLRDDAVRDVRLMIADILCSARGAMAEAEWPGDSFDVTEDVLTLLLSAQALNKANGTLIGIRDALEATT